MTNRALALANDMPAPDEWTLMRDMAKSLVPTGFLPDSIKTPEQAVAIMLKGRELNVPAMYSLSNISIVKGKPTISAEMMLALIYRDHGKRAIRIKTSDDTQCTIEYRLDGWDDTSTYAFTIDQAKKAQLTNNPTWGRYPAAMLRARCVSAVARMAFPESIAGMYVPGELGEDVIVTDDGEVTSVNTTTGEIAGAPEVPPMADVAPEATQQRQDTPTMPQVNNHPQPQDAPAQTHTEAQPASIDRERVMRRLHAVASDKSITHDNLRTLAQAKADHDIESLKDADPQMLSDMADAIEKDNGKIRAWLDEQNAKQEELMPNVIDVPNPERFTQ